MLNGIFLVVEAVGGWLSGSLALLSDAAHMLGDVGGLVLAYAAAHIADRVGGVTQTFGFRRVEVLGAFVNGILLVLASGWILVEAMERIVSGVPEPMGLPILVIGIVGLLINLGSAAALWKSDDGSLNVRGALIHMLADALGSVGAIAAGLLVMKDMPLADPLVSLLIAGLVLFATWRLLNDSGRILLQFAPSGTDVPAVRESLHELGGVSSLHDFHIWTLDGRLPILSVHLVLDAEAEPQDVHAAALDMLATKHGIWHATVQVEDAALPGRMHGHS
ncbi:MAG: cation transporter [Proteobacteria bacterium]|nr:cation transporter [Pseudomonadota bacterium]MCP4919384.1 cation transporter [Pseudomonadota bacterium]